MLEGVLALNAIWFAMGTVSLHQYDTWQLSWWLYHGQLLLGVITTVVMLARRYEQVRRFRLTAYFAAAGLIATAVLSITAAILWRGAIQRTPAWRLADGDRA